VLHIHNIRYDNEAGHYWVLAGDHGDEPGVGISSADLLNFHWLIKGEQRYRAVDFFSFPDHLIYAQDTEMESNSTRKRGRRNDYDTSTAAACTLVNPAIYTPSQRPSSLRE
jgi:hypothetical protein